MSSVVYWLHLPEHTDMFTQGYIGVTNDLKKRWNEHKNNTNRYLTNVINKYGWDTLVKEIILIADKAYCFMIEAKLRPERKIGWNIVKGGNAPIPVGGHNKGKPMSEETKAKLSAALKGRRVWNKGLKYDEKMRERIFNIAEYMKDKPHGMLGRKMSPESIEAIRQKKLGVKRNKAPKEKGVI